LANQPVLNVLAAGKHPDFSSWLHFREAENPVPLSITSAFCFSAVVFSQARA
jgi:hypothetical protein